jgi:hypothetical protein
MMDGRFCALLIELVADAGMQLAQVVGAEVGHGIR